MPSSHLDSDASSSSDESYTRRYVRSVVRQVMRPPTPPVQRDRDEVYPEDSASQAGLKAASPGKEATAKVSSAGTQTAANRLEGDDEEYQAILRVNALEIDEEEQEMASMRAAREARQARRMRQYEARREADLPATDVQIPPRVPSVDDSCVEHESSKARANGKRKKKAGKSISMIELGAVKDLPDLSLPEARQSLEDRLNPKPGASYDQVSASCVERAATGEAPLKRRKRKKAKKGERYVEVESKADPKDLRRGGLADGCAEAKSSTRGPHGEGVEPAFDWGRLGGRTTASDVEARREPPAEGPRRSTRRPREEDADVSPPHRRRREVRGGTYVEDRVSGLPELGDHSLPQRWLSASLGRQEDGRTTRPGRDDRLSPGGYGLGSQILGSAVPRVRRSEEEQHCRIQISGVPETRVRYLDEVERHGPRVIPEELPPRVRYAEQESMPSVERRRRSRYPEDHGRSPIHGRRAGLMGRTPTSSDDEVAGEPSARGLPPLEYMDQGRRRGSHRDCSAARSWSIPGGPVEVEPFDGDPIAYQRFVYQFKEAVEARAPHPHTRINLLMRLCVGDARLAIQGCIHSHPEEGYRRAWQILHDRYGSSREVARKWLATLTQFRGPVRRYAELFRGFYESLSGMNALNEMDTDVNLEPDHWPTSRHVAASIDTRTPLCDASGRRGAGREGSEAGRRREEEV